MFYLCDHGHEMLMALFTLRANQLKWAYVSKFSFISRQVGIGCFLTKRQYLPWHVNLWRFIVITPS